MRKISFTRLFLKLLPPFIRFPFMRSQIRVPKELDPRFTFRVARRTNELSAAYAILHDAYVDMGYMNPDASGMRLLKYFALPTTTTLIALYDDQVVGTISIVRRGSFGLPMDKQFDIDATISQDKVIAEVSSLAIDKDFRARRGELFFPLIKYFWEYVVAFMRLDALVITVNPSMSDFYEGFLGFKRIKGSQIKKYDFANGHPGVGLWYDVNNAANVMQSFYGHKSDEKNLCRYFLDLKLPHFIFPNRDFYKSSDPVMNQEMLEFFFVKKSNVIRRMSKTEKMGLISSYPPGFVDFLFRHESSASMKRKSLRKVQRHSVKINSHIKGLEKHPVVILDAGSKGMRISCPLKLVGELEFRVLVAKDTVANVTGVVRWQEGTIYGIKLLDTDLQWHRFFKYLQRDYDELQEQIDASAQGTKAAA